MDGRAEAHLIEIACGPAPEGHSRWTLRLLEGQSKMILDIYELPYNPTVPVVCKDEKPYQLLGEAREQRTSIDWAEIELNVMTRQCLSRRIGVMDKLKEELSAWENNRNADKSEIRWHYKTGDAREKLISLYPVTSAVSS